MNGTLIQGNITANKLQGALLGKQLSELELRMQNNSTYVNIHTTIHPNGEIRGQIISANLTHADHDELGKLISNIIGSRLLNLNWIIQRPCLMIKVLQ
jgi:CHRD domain